MPEPKFVQRLVRLPELIEVVASYPHGILLSDLAVQFDTPVGVLHQDLLTFMEMASVGYSRDIKVFNGEVVELVAPTAEDDADLGDLLVKVVDDTPTAPMGVEHLNAGDLALVYSAGLAWLDADPTDTDLADALGVIAETMYGETAPADYSPAEWNRLLPLLQQAQAERRQVDIVYSRAWTPGVSERTIEPLSVVLTKRGWEVDAGPVAADGSLRTFLLSNMRDAELRDETFDLPSRLDWRLEKQRRTTTVRMALAQDARWATDMYAERTTIVSEDETEFVADVELLPPAAERVALLMLASGRDARVMEGAGVLADACAFIDGLIEHHSG